MRYTWYGTATTVNWVPIVDTICPENSRRKSCEWRIGPMSTKRRRRGTAAKATGDDAPDPAATGRRGWRSRSIGPLVGSTARAAWPAGRPDRSMASGNADDAQGQRRAGGGGPPGRRHQVRGQIGADHRIAPVVEGDRLWEQIGTDPMAVAHDRVEHHPEAPHRQAPDASVGVGVGR